MEIHLSVLTNYFAYIQTCLFAFTSHVNKFGFAVHTSFIALILFSLSLAATNQNYIGLLIHWNKKEMLSMGIEIIICNLNYPFRSLQILRVLKKKMWTKVSVGDDILQKANVDMGV